MRFHVASRVRSAAFRMRYLSFAKTCSTGLRSGLYPQRQSLGRQVASRVYRSDNVVVVNAHADQTWVDRSGNTTAVAIRSSVTWAKIDGKWLTIDFHVSKVPGTP